MKINTESKNYSRFRNCLNASSYFGGCLAFDSVVIPFTKAVLNGKLRILRPFAYLGTYGLSICVGAIAAGGIDWAADVIVNVINDEPKNDIPEEPVSWYKETKKTKIDPKNATPSEEMELVNDFVAEAKIFEFDSEEQAKAAAEKLHGVVSCYGFCTIADYCKCIGVHVPENIYDIAFKCGWTRDTLGKLAIEKIRDDEWILDAINYHDVSNLYQVYRNERSNNSKEG